MRFKNSDLIITMVVVALNIVWLLVPSQFIVITILFALPLTLILPGYTLTQTLFRRGKLEQQPDTANNHPSLSEFKMWHPVGNVDRIVLSFGLSMAIDVLIGFLLNLLPVGLDRLSWTLALALFTTIFALWAMFLRRKDVVTMPSADASRLRIIWVDGALFGLALLVIISSVWLSLIRPIQPQPSFTQLWMLPANQADKSCAVSLGVQSFETAAETYHITLAVNATQTNNWSSIVLAPQQKWVQVVPITPGANTSLFIEAQLYRASQPNNVYRDVHLTLYISSTNVNGLIHQQCALES